MLVRDVMQQDVVTVDAEANLDVTEELMRMDRIRHLPVLSGGRLVGVVTQRDLFRAALSSAIGAPPSAEQRWLAGIPVRQVMATEVFSAHPGAELRYAVKLMLRERVGCLPVVEDGRLVGLLSESDCLRCLAELLVD